MIGKESLQRNPTLETFDKVITGLKEAKMPVSASYLKSKLNVDFDSITVILTRLINQKKVKKIKTSRGITFEWIGDNNDTKEVVTSG